MNDKVKGMLSECFFLELYSERQGTGGLRINNVRFETGARLVDGEMCRHVLFGDLILHKKTEGEVDPEAAFLRTEPVSYCITRNSDGAQCCGVAMVTTGPRIEQIDGSVAMLVTEMIGPFTKFDDGGSPVDRGAFIAARLPPQPVPDEHLTMLRAARRASEADGWSGFVRREG